MRSSHALIPSLVLLFAGGCPSTDDDDDSAVAIHGDDDDSAAVLPCGWGLASVCADEVVDAPGANDGPFGDPWAAVNGVRGGGQSAGGADVFSLDHDAGATLTLRWSGRRVLDGPGVDLVVYENAFEYAPGAFFMDLAVVEVSIDGVAWIALPHDLVSADEATWSPDPTHWLGFAGRGPVLLHEETNRVDPLDPSVAGGDGFDLADLPEDGALGTAIRAEGFAFLRLATAPSRVNPDTGAAYPHDPVANGADIDGVYARTLVAE